MKAYAEYTVHLKCRLKNVKEQIEKNSTRDAPQKNQKNKDFNSLECQVLTNRDASVTVMTDV